MLNTTFITGAAALTREPSTDTTMLIACIAICAKVTNNCLMLVQIEFIKSCVVWLVLYKCTNAATTTAIVATTPNIDTPTRLNTSDTAVKAAFTPSPPSSIGFNHE